MLSPTQAKTSGAKAPLLFWTQYGTAEAVPLSRTARASARMSTHVMKPLLALITEMKCRKQIPPLRYNDKQKDRGVPHLRR
jgi:hypothetical protein